MPETAHRLLTLTTQIVAAYMGANTVNATAVPALISDIHRSLAELDRSSAVETAKPPSSELPSITPPAVEIRKSVSADRLVCLEDGLEVTMLRRHLRTAHGLTPERYRAKWGLPWNYPMVAPNYAKVRSRLAKEAGLGRKRWPAK